MPSRMVIAVLVPAADADEALSAARCPLDRLVGFGAREPVFDSYTTFADRERRHWETRWDDLPPATPVAAEPGASFLERQWAETCRAFAATLSRIQELLATHTDRELMQNADQARQAFHDAGATEGPMVYLYDEHGLGIRHRERLDAVLEGDDRLWIVPAVVRY